MPKIKSAFSACVFLLFLLPLTAFTPPRLSRIKVTEGISVLIPKGWRPMDGLDFTERYPSVRAPLAAYSDEERMVDFSVNISATQWPDKDVALAEKFFRASILNMFDRVEMINEGRHVINNNEFIFFEFESTMKGNKRELGQGDAILKYSYIQYLLTPERTLVFSFHCPRRIRADWQETAHKMMDGIKVKKVKPAASADQPRTK